jgi:hypothetical protein
VYVQWPWGPPQAWPELCCVTPFEADVELTTASRETVQAKVPAVCAAPATLARKACRPVERPCTAWGEVHDENAPPSNEHSNALAPSAEKVNDADVADVVQPVASHGPDEIVTGDGGGTDDPPPEADPP